MIPNRTLLIPIDFSNASKVAVKFALSNEYKKGDKLILLHCYRLIDDDYFSYRNTPLKLKKLIEQKLQRKFNSFSKSLSLDQYYPDVEFGMKMGFIANCIHTFYNECPTDLIIFGLKKNKSSHTLIQLISENQVPVMLIEENLNLEKYIPDETKTLNPTDFSSQPNRYLKEVHTHPDTPYLVLT
ncbi:MAG: universal stress protein [Reichenbachiella sp.]|uniref:universal stress protein n=1 Tax=Reichenbachiella sp. TaxID=2184521 RepID=UPI003299DDA8